MDHLSPMTTWLCRNPKRRMEVKYDETHGVVWVRLWDAVGNCVSSAAPTVEQAMVDSLNTQMAVDADG